ncbi:MAG: hypothetical protein ACKVWR_05045 [Acidimicrobiales bacterium]
MELTSFVGHLRELDELTNLVEECRLVTVTVTGPGGSDKTRLAGEVLGRLTAAGEEEAVRVELEAVSDASRWSRSQPTRWVCWWGRRTIVRRRWPGRFVTAGCW